MTEHSLTSDESPDAPAAVTRRAAPMFTMLEGSALVLAAVTLLLIYSALTQMGQSSAGLGNGAAWLLIPHIALIGLIVGGLRRVATILMTFILLAACLVGLVACLDSLMRTHDAHGLGFAAMLQLPLFILCFRIARTPFSLEELAARGPRLALGLVLGVGGSFLASEVAKRADAPNRARIAAAEAARLTEFARRDAKAHVAALTACLQRVPVTPDSQPDFPVALSALPLETCPEAGRPAPGGFTLDYTAGAPDADGHRRTFHLIEHSEPMTDSARSYESDESMVLHDWYGPDERRLNIGTSYAMEAFASAGRCIEEARTTPDPGGRVLYPASIAALKRGNRCSLAPTADSSALIVGASGGRYFVRYTPPSGPREADAPGGYSLSMEPGRDSLGRSTGGPLLSFYSDTSGAIHMTRRGRAATLADSVLPDCPGYPRRANNTVPICREWMPRQRWGLTSELPTIGWSRSGSGTVGAGDTLFLIPQYVPIARSDTISEAHVQWDAAGPDSVIRRRAGRIGEVFGNGISIRLHHVYADTGIKRIHFWIRAGDGGRYEFHDSVRVLLPSRRREAPSR